MNADERHDAEAAYCFLCDMVSRTICTVSDKKKLESVMNVIKRLCENVPETASTSLEVALSSIVSAKGLINCDNPIMDLIVRSETDIRTAIKILEEDVIS